MNQNPSLPSMMAWQIFRKDWKLLWPLVLAAAAGQALLAMVLYRHEPYAASQPVNATAMLLSLGLGVAWCLLIVLAVQQDAIPGVDQDWLVRPIRRRDLLLAKILFIVLLVHGPAAGAHLLRGLAEGFGFGETLRAALLAAVELALLVSLPVMAIAALTRSVTEAALGALAVLFGLLLARLMLHAMLFPFTHVFGFEDAVDGSGIAWVWRSLSHLWLLLAMAVVLALQYFRRSTRPSRLLFIGGLFIFMQISALPWRPAFALQQWLSAQPDAARSVSVAFDPARHAADTDAGQLDTLLFAGNPEEKKPKKGKKEKKAGSEDTPPILLPLQFSGLPAGLILHADRTVLRLVDADGRTLYRGNGHDFDLPVPDHGNEQALLYQSFRIPAAVVQKAGDHALRLELDYSLTLLRPHALPPLPAQSSNQSLGTIGQCAGRIDDTGDAIEVGCRAAGELPPCLSMTLQLADGTRRNPEKFVCEMNYQPDFLRFSMEPFDRAEATLPFRDPAGAVHYPVDETRLHGAQVAISVYEPEAHFSRHLVIAQLHLRDWQAAAPSASEQPADAAPPAPAVQP